MSVATVAGGEGVGHLLDSGCIAVELDDPLARAWVTATKLESLAERWRVEAFYIEDTWCGPNKQTALMLTRMQGVIIGRLYDLGLVPPRLVAPSRWRRALGFKSRTSEECKAEALDYWGGLIKDVDEAEGACIARAGGTLEHGGR